MNHKNFNFDLYYFPMQTSNIFQSIKIEQKNKNKVYNKNGCGVKRFSFKNELNFEEIPELFHFQKSNRKNKRKYPRQIKTPTSNQSIKSVIGSSGSKVWSPDFKIIEENIHEKNMNNERV